MSSKIGSSDPEASLRYTDFLPQSGRLFEETWPVEVDVTDSIKVYENGKVLTCPCGAGMGTKKRKLKIKCYSCKDFVLIDNDALDRENQTPESEKEDQQEDRGVFDGLASKGLGNWT